jgi:primosomal protein N' (replication factor Y) (superfamily II helicase)
VEQVIVQVILDAPLDVSFDYSWPAHEQRAPQIGQLVNVPFGKRETTGLVVAIKEQSAFSEERLKAVIDANFQLPPLSARWIALCQFAADYYQRPLGEVALPALPKNLRSAKPAQLEKAYKKLSKEAAHAPNDAASPVLPTLNPEQQNAADQIADSIGFTPILLYGVTGSGKTEVYLRAAQRILERETQEETPQVLILVPEINLTPQLESHLRARFPSLRIATLHSGLAEGERMQHWLAAHLGQAQIVLGTRLAVMASMPHLRLIIIDEEHDASYKQQEGLRYSARDLAVWRAHQLQIPVVLGSATPSIETWQHAQTKRYRQLDLRERAVKDAELPTVRVIDMERDKPVEGLTPSLIAALKRRMACGEQSLLYLNRRGYAPVLHCDACGWISNCKRCTAFMVLHRPERRLRCHHCSLELIIPRACPTCGNIDLQPLGRGTQRIEEGLANLFPDARILRIDADSTRRKGSAQAAFEQVHRGDVDILIGTQMVAKGHDFKNLTLVGILNPDTALFSHDYRAGERLFAQLMQVAGRAGRTAQKDGGNASEVLIQTRYPHHPLYGAAAAHDYERFASGLLEERKQAGLPPFIFQALLRAEAKELQIALDFLAQAAQCLAHPGIVINDPIPMTMTRVANLDRAQLLIESESRPLLQGFLKDWMQTMRAMKTRVRWSLEVDPMDI